MKTRNEIAATSLLLATLLANAHGAEAPLTQITTIDGKTYNSVTVLRSEPDGIIINYQPETPGIGMAKIRFQNLPDTVRSRYGYDADKASEFEKQQTQAAAQWRAQSVMADESLARYRAFAELNRVLGGDAVSSYSVSLSPDGKISAQGFTGGIPPYTYCYPWFSTSPGGTQNATRPSAY